MAMVMATPHIHTLTPLQPSLLCQFIPKRSPLSFLGAGQADKAFFNMSYLLHVRIVEDTGNEKDNNERITDQVMGEAINHLSKMVSTCKINRHLDSMSEVINFLGNCWTWPQLSWDTERGKPAFIQCIEELGNHLSKPEIKRWFKRVCFRPEGSTSHGLFSTSLHR